MEKLGRTFLCTLLFGGMICLCLQGTASAQAGINLGIDDSGEALVVPVGQAPYGFDPTSFNLQQNIEGLDVHGEYSSQTLIPNGQAIVVNVNFFDLNEPIQPWIGDTLNMVFTGHTPVPGDQNNISVDIHFRSDTDTTSLPPLVNGIPVNEVPGFMVMDGLILQGGGPNDFHLAIQSVPEPSTFVMLGLGIVSLFAYRLRRRFA